MTSSVAGLRRSYESLPKAKLAPKEKVMVTDGGLLPVWSTIAFWFRAKPLPLRSMLNKLMRCMENCNKCSQHWSTEWPQFSMTMPDHMSHASHTTNASKFEWTGLQSLDSSVILTWPLANNLPLLQASWQLFAGKTLPQPAGGRKCFTFRVHWIPKHWFLHYRNKSLYFSLAKMCWF